MANGDIDSWRGPNGNTLTEPTRKHATRSVTKLINPKRSLRTAACTHILGWKKNSILSMLARSLPMRSDFMIFTVIYWSGCRTATLIAMLMYLQLGLLRL